MRIIFQVGDSSFARSVVMGCFASIVTYHSTVALSAVAQNAPATKADRARDTHVIDQVPIFDVPEHATVEKAAQRQIEEEACGNQERLRRRCR